MTLLAQAEPGNGFLLVYLRLVVLIGAVTAICASLLTLFFLLGRKLDGTEPGKVEPAGE